MTKLEYLTARNILQEAAIKDSVKIFNDFYPFRVGVNEGMLVQLLFRISIPSSIMLKSLLKPEYLFQPRFLFKRLFSSRLLIKMYLPILGFPGVCRLEFALLKSMVVCFSL